MKSVILILTVLLFSFAAFGQADRDKGIGLYQSNDFDAAAAVLQDALKADPNDRDAWMYLGMSLARVKKHKEAVKAFRHGYSITDKSSKSSLYDKDVKIMAKPRARYNDAARQNMTRGVVRLAVEFGADKKIKAVVAFEKLPDGLTEDCIAAAKGIKFDPASRNGDPVSLIRVVEYQFEIY